MQTMQLTGASLDTLRAVEHPDPKPRRGEALVRMHAASLNYIDLIVANGFFPGTVFPLIPVADGAGEVVEVGEEVDGVRVGDRVAIHPKALWAAGRGTAQNAGPMRGATLPGSLREFAALAADTLVRAPDHLSWEAIAALPIAATTAWNALACAGIGPGDSVVLLGTGGVSIFALQLAKARGARVIITSSSDEKLERAKSLGADQLINYRRTPAWDEAVASITAGRGADLVLETAGSTTFARSLAAAAQGGTIFTIGFLSGRTVDLDVLTIVSKALRVQGNNTGSAADLRDAVRAIAAHAISPVLDRIYPITEIKQAYEQLGEGAHLGKLAISLAWPAR